MGKFREYRAAVGFKNICRAVHFENKAVPRHRDIYHVQHPHVAYSFSSSSILRSPDINMSLVHKILLDQAKRPFNPPGILITQEHGQFDSHTAHRGFGPIAPASAATRLWVSSHNHYLTWVWWEIQVLYGRTCLPKLRSWEPRKTYLY